MSDTKINIGVFCSFHPTEKLEVTTDRIGTVYDFTLLVSACSECLRNALTEADPVDLPAKSAELIFNESNFTSQTIEV